jgi:glutamine cyclotransferase
MKKTALFVVTLALASAVAVSTQGIPPIPAWNPTVPVFGYDIVKTYPHATDALTQGLIYQDGFLWESTGERGRSRLRKVELETGKMLQEHQVDPMYQAEGMALFKGQFFQLTLRGGFGFIYDQSTLTEHGRFTYAYPTAAWGIAHDGKRLIITGPSSTIRFYDPATMMETGSVVVKDGATEIPRVDELEIINGELWANIYQTPRIAVINMDSGKVIKWVDLSGIAAPDGRFIPPQEGATADWVLNGIAYDQGRDRLFVTGKNWPTLYEIKLKPRAAS